MQEEVKIEPSEKLAYWVGVAQSDGSFRTYWEKDRKSAKYLISLCVAEKSFPMLLKFTELSKMLFKRKSGIWKESKRERWIMHIGVTRLLETFKTLDIDFKDPPRPPFWTIKTPKSFGAYLAGLIDGDGSVCIKRPKYPQCIIKIGSGSEQKELSSAIRKLLKCSISITSYKAKKEIVSGRFSDCKWTVLEFLVSSKTYKFLKDFTLPHMQLIYKKRKIEDYISSRWLCNDGVVI
ncbi:MAG: hypothetical protein HY361_01950 [Candidatus Aenigmarchaeota archaeon]|nr:hypothetical protein [Candidatus Aenigmarchaeota archaeon]